MIQKMSYSLNTKVNRPFYDMVKIRVIIIWSDNIFTKYETLFENGITILPITHQNKTKMPGKNRMCLVYLWEVAGYINYIQAIWAKLLVELFRV